MDAPMVGKADTGLEVPESMVYFVFMTMFIDVIAACISTPVMPYYAQEFGVSTAWIGYIYAAWSVTSAVFAPVLSGMADKWGRKKVMVTCLTGAGVANIIQGVALYFGHNGFWIFLFGRAFSGCFASIGATCNVYITDVCTNEATRNKFLGQMSMVPLVAIMVGPGLGGGLAAAFGNNVPVLIDGLLTLFSAVVVNSFLEETPAFLRSRLNADVEKGQEKKEKPLLPTAIYIVGLAAFLTSLAGQMNLSMYSLFFQKIYDFSALYIGFVFMGNAVVMLLTNMVILPKLRKCLKSAQMYFGGQLVSGCGVISLGLSSLVGNVHLSLSCVYFGGVGGATSMSQASSIVASFTDVSNRGRIFGLIQTFQNIGKIIGPMVATNVAVHGVFGYKGFFGLPFLMSGTCTMIAGGVMLSSLAFMQTPKVEPEAAPKDSKVNRRATTFGTQWENEQGSEEDVKALGKYVSQLLTDRHYKWVTRRADIERLLDDVLPELKVESRDAYEESFKQQQTMRLQVASMAQMG